VARPVELTIKGVNPEDDSEGIPVMIDADTTSCVYPSEKGTVVRSSNGGRVVARESYDEVLRLIGWRQSAEAFGVSRGDMVV